MRDPKSAARNPETTVPARPTPAARISFVLRGVALWLGIHLGMAFLGMVLFNPLQVAFMLIVVYVGVRWDQRVRREDILLGNAGVAPWVGPAHSVAGAAAVEAAVQVLAWSAA